MKWHRIKDGVVTGVMTMDRATAEKNLQPGETLEPFDPDRTIPAPPQLDARRMRATGYPSAGDQLGCLMDLMADILDGKAPDRREFDALSAQIRVIKEAHPKPRKQESP